MWRLPNHNWGYCKVKKNYKSYRYLFTDFAEFISKNTCIVFRFYIIVYPVFAASVIFYTCMQSWITAQIKFTTEGDLCYCQLAVFILTIELGLGIWSHVQKFQISMVIFFVKLALDINTYKGYRNVVPLVLISSQLPISNLKIIQ